MRATRCTGSGIAIERNASGSGKGCNCCPTNGTCAAAGPGTTPSVWTVTFSGLALCAGCRSGSVANSGNTTFVLSGTFDLECVAFGSAVSGTLEGSVWRYVGTAGGLVDGGFTSANTTCTGLTPFLTLQIQLRVFTTGGVKKIEVQAGLTTSATYNLPAGGSGANAFGPGWLFFSQMNLTSDCEDAHTMASSMACGGGGITSVILNGGGSVTATPSSAGGGEGMMAEEEEFFFWE